MTIAGTVAQYGVPEAAPARRPRPRVRENANKTEVVEFDCKPFAILRRWTLSPCATLARLALDSERRRLYSTCGNSRMIVLNADTGYKLATLDIGRGCNGAAFDAMIRLTFSSNDGDGAPSIVSERGPGNYVAATVPTQPGARTMALNPKIHRTYLPSTTQADAPEK